MSEPRLIVILGPTAGGKSDLAVELALKLRSSVVTDAEIPRRCAHDAEIISADSMQVYRHLNIGTAKPTPADRSRVKHHLIDVMDPTVRFTVYDWVQSAEAIVRDLLERGAWPIVVGGTNLYIKALLQGLFEGPEADEPFRQSLEGVPGVQLHQRLREVDPIAADRINPQDTKRLTRALEVFRLTGRPITGLQTQWEYSSKSPLPADLPTGEGDAAETGCYRFEPILIGLDWPAELINRRINQRVKAMFYPDQVEAELAAQYCRSAENLPQEVQRLTEGGLLGPQAREALGYKQISQHLEGQCTLEEAFEATKIQTRRFAKQQRTWLRRFRGVHWLKAATLSLDQCAVASMNIVRSVKC